jgi:predicted alpha/beta-fold hydrolase
MCLLELLSVCSGEINRARRLYSHGEIDDIGVVVEHALNNYKNIAQIATAWVSL